MRNDGENKYNYGAGKDVYDRDAYRDTGGEIRDRAARVSTRAFTGRSSSGVRCTFSHTAFNSVQFSLLHFTSPHFSFQSVRFSSVFSSGQQLSVQFSSVQFSSVTGAPVSPELNFENNDRRKKIIERT